MAQSISTNNQFSSVTAASQRFGTALLEGTPYQVTSSVGAWIRFDSATPTATVGAGSSYVPPNFPIEIMGPSGGLNTLAIIRDGASSGNATLTQMI